MSRQSYRKSLQNLIEDDQDVFHIISTDNGGADHMDNYDFVRGSNWNRAIGSKFDHINCYQVGKLKCSKAVAISILLGSYSCSKDHPKHKKYLGPSAAELYSLGEEVMRDLRARRQSGDKYKKRGLGLWTMPNAVSALHDHAPSVEWYYTWTLDSLGTGTGKEFIPMVWDQRDMSSVVGKRVPLLMTFNEPDNASQANMSVSDALSHWPALQGVADRLGSPACAGDVLGTGTWMDEFMTGCVSNGYRVDFMCVHAYQPAALSAQDATAALELYLKKVHVKYNKPIWLTEYSMVSWGAAIPGGKYEATFPSTATQVEFASSSAAMLDSLPFVERYAWFSGFKYLVDNPSENSFVFLDSGLELTSTGVAYAG